MMRMIVKWMISRSIDEGRAVPAWVRRRIDGDEELKLFELRSRQLGNRLKSDSSEWIAAHSLTVVESSVGSDAASAGDGRRRFAWFTVAVTGLAAAIVLAIALNRIPENSIVQNGPVRKQPVVVIAPSVDADREALMVSDWLIKSVKKSRETFEQVHSRTRDLPIRIEDLKLPSLSEIAEPVKVAGSTAGQMYAALDQGMETEQKLLAGEMKTVYLFFTDRLPGAIVKLTGWNPAG